MTDVYFPQTFFQVFTFYNPNEVVTPGITTGNGPETDIRLTPSSLINDYVSVQIRVFMEFLKQTMNLILVEFSQFRVSSIWFDETTKHDILSLTFNCLIAMSREIAPLVDRVCSAAISNTASATNNSSMKELFFAQTFLNNYHNKHYINKLARTRYFRNNYCSFAICYL